DGAIHGINGVMQVSQPFIGLALLKPRPIRLWLECKCLVCIFESIRWVARPVVVCGEIYVRRRKRSLSCLVHSDGFFIVGHSTRVVAQRFQSEAESIQRFYVGWINLESFFEFLPRILPVILNGVQLAEVVANLRRLRAVVNSLFELNLRLIESPDNHQIAAENLMSLGVPDIKLKRLRQTLNGISNPLLRKLAVAQCVPAPCPFWTLLEVVRQDRLRLFETARPNVILNFLYFRRIITRYFGVEFVKFLTGVRITWI